MALHGGPGIRAPAAHLAVHLERLHRVLVGLEVEGQPQRAVAVVVLSGAAHVADDVHVELHLGAWVNEARRCTHTRGRIRRHGRVVLFHPAMVKASREL